MGYEPVTEGLDAERIQGRLISFDPPSNGDELTWNSTDNQWEPKPEAASSGGAWGDITGTLSDQTDLQSALDAKLTTNSGTDALRDVLAAAPSESRSVIQISDTGSVSYRSPSDLLADIAAQPADPQLDAWAGITPGTGVGTALAVNIGSAGAPVVQNGALGTPSSGTGTNLTGIPESGVTSLVSDLALKAPLASPTFTGTVTLPSGQALIAPALGTPASGVVTNLTGTASININGTVGATTPGTGAFTTLSNTGAATNSKSGAASTSALAVTGVPFAGTGTTSFPLVYINDANATASTTLNTAGTYLGVNGDGTQDLMNLLKDGTSVVKVTSTHIEGASGSVSAPTYSFSSLTNSGTFAAAGGPAWSAQGTAILAAFNGAKDGIVLRNDGQIIFSATITDAQPTADIGMARNAAGVLEVNSGTIGTFRDLKSRYLYTAVTNDASVAGTIGEYVSASVIQGSATALTTATPKTVTSISLTAGDWDVTGIGCSTGASTGTNFTVAIGTTTNSLTGTVLGDTQCQTPTVSLTGADATLMIPAVRISISSTTTIYLIVQETFTIGTPAAYGRISARRVR